MNSTISRLRVDTVEEKGRREREEGEEEEGREEKEGVVVAVV